MAKGRPDNRSRAPEQRTEAGKEARHSGARRVLDDFELVVEIGRGGMGTVYRAIQRSLQRTVAVKVLSPQVSSSPKAVLRFQREAVAAAKLQHLHIVPIFALGESDGLYYYAMEYIDGPSLAAVIDALRVRRTAKAESADAAETVELPRTAKGRYVPDEPGTGSARLPPQGFDRDTSGVETEAHSFIGAGDSRGSLEGSSVDEPDSSVILDAGAWGTKSDDRTFVQIAEHIASIADALDFAHQQGVIHRDIKPHNLLFGGDGRLRVSDFGLARLSEQPGVTLTGELIGSPLYMSPEQITGDPGGVDHRTDIYSLGATLYEWLTLSPPYPGQTREQVISKLLTGQAPSPRTLNPLIPIDLETICTKAIERDPRRRYQTIGRMRDDLRRFAQHRPIEARRASLMSRSIRFVNHHKISSIITTAAVIAFALLLALASKERQVRTFEAVALQAAEEHEKLRQDVTDVLSLFPPEIRGPARLLEAGVPVVQELLETSRLGDGAARPDGSGAAEVPGPADPASVSTVAGIARRAGRDYFAAIAPEGRPESIAGASLEESSLLYRAVERIRMQPDNVVELTVASELVEEFLHREADHYGALLLQVYLEHRLGRFASMPDTAQRMMQLRPDDPAPQIWLLLALLLVDDASALSESIATLARVPAEPAASPLTTEETAWLLNLRGLALLRLERLAEAAESFSAALTKNDDLMTAALGRSAARARLTDFPGAIADLTTVLEREPDNAAVLVRRGDLFFAVDDYAAAARDYDAAIAIAGRTPALSFRHLTAQVKLGEGEKPDAPLSNPARDVEDEARKNDLREGSKPRPILEWLSRMFQSVPRNQNDGLSPSSGLLRLLSGLANRFLFG